jgi:hypothetical protein
VTAADVITCYLCGRDWPENDDGIFIPRQPTTAEARCTDYDACSQRQARNEEQPDD